MNVEMTSSLKLCLNIITIATSVLCPALAPAKTIVETGQTTVWKYDVAPEPPASWHEPGFDDSHWKECVAPLGYGEEAVHSIIAEESEADRPVSARFRLTFTSPQLRTGEGLVLFYCVDDGAVFFLNGKEVGRVHLADGPTTPDTFATHNVGRREEGLYRRMPIPADDLREGEENLLAVEVRQFSRLSDDLYFDVALKAVPHADPGAHVAADALEVIRMFNEDHYIGPGVRVPDGYVDGGRAMRVDDNGTAKSGREILLVNREHDDELARDAEFVHTPEFQALSTLDKVQHLAARVDELTTPPGGQRWVGEMTMMLQDEFQNRPLLIGDWVDQCQAGVCRHRSLLFKILADEAGLQAALVRGNYAVNGSPVGGHAWNEVFLEDGRRILIDVMHNGGKPVFPAVTDPDVVSHYIRVDNAPWYSSSSAETK